MSTENITKKVEELLELEDFAEQIKSEAEALKKEIQNEMAERNVEELIP